MNFDYEKKKWGTGEVDLNPKFLGATRLKYALLALEKVSKGKVLEVGCGGGAFIRAIKRHRLELEVIGCDLGQEVIIEAKKKKGAVKYRQADVYQLPFKNKSFEAVVSFDVWEHLEKPSLAFQEVNRVLKPGGIFHFFVPLEGGPTHLFRLLPKKIFNIKKAYTGHIQAFSQNELKKLLSGAGFKVEKYHYSCYYLYQLIDALYFSFLRLRGKNTAVSVEGYLEFAKGSLFDRILSLARVLFGWGTYLENEIFRLLPGGGIHMTAVKKLKVKSAKFKIMNFLDEDY